MILRAALAPCQCGLPLCPFCQQLVGLELLRLGGVPSAASILRTFHMLIQHNLTTEDQQLVEALGIYAAELQPFRAVGLRAKWNAQGPGPVALTGGEWVSGVLLGPQYRVGVASRACALEWDWTPEKLGEWRGHSEVRILLMDTAVRSSWTIDVTDSERSTIILPSHIELSANCLALFQLKAGDRIGKLHRPPYVKTAGLTMRYRY